MSTSCAQTYLLPVPVMIIKLSLDEENLQMPCVHVKQESRKALKFGGPLRLNRVDLSCMAKIQFLLCRSCNVWGYEGHGSQCLHLYDVKQLQLTLIMM